MKQDNEKVKLYPNRIEFNPPITPETLKRLSVADKKKIIKFVGIVTGTENPSDERILNFLDILGLKKNDEKN